MPIFCSKKQLTPGTVVRPAAIVLLSETLASRPVRIVRESTREEYLKEFPGELFNTADYPYYYEAVIAEDVAILSEFKGNQV